MTSVLLFQKLYFFDGKIFYRMTAVYNSAGCENWLLLMNQHKNRNYALFLTGQWKQDDTTRAGSAQCLSLSIHSAVLAVHDKGPDCLLIRTTEGCFCSHFSDCPPLSFKESWSFSTTNSRTSLSMQSWRLMCSRASEKWAMPFSSASLLSRLW